MPQNNIFGQFHFMSSASNAIILSIRTSGLGCAFIGKSGQAPNAAKVKQKFRLIRREWKWKGISR